MTDSKVGHRQPGIRTADDRADGTDNHIDQKMGIILVYTAEVRAIAILLNQSGWVAILIQAPVPMTETLRNASTHSVEERKWFPLGLSGSELNFVGHQKTKATAPVRLSLLLPPSRFSRFPDSARPTGGYRG